MIVPWVFNVVLFLLHSFVKILKQDPEKQIVNIMSGK